ncbi:L-rhamnose-binding lectin CSL1-like isoform X2 [Saccostrea cucullata]|uniref:L-rhamnose-binding lectin CSL1-like isoform X2 n=1 Tax=Saccostrea cuccullata TaxID=36930 RepID=UPI002ED1519F
MKVPLILGILLASVHYSIQLEDKTETAAITDEEEEQHGHLSDEETEEEERPVQLPAKDARDLEEESERSTQDKETEEEERPVQLPAREVKELEERDVRGFRRSFACANQRLNLWCGRGRTIRVLYTTHKRNDRRCSSLRPKCWTRWSRFQVGRTCNGRTRCRVGARGRCPTYTSSLNVVYTCRKQKKCSKKCVKNAQCVKGKCRCKRGFAWSKRRRQCVRKGRRCGKKNKCGKNAWCFRGRCRCLQGFRWNKAKRQCIRRRFTSVIRWFKVGKGTACEHKNLTLHCSRGRVIRTFYAVYGRRNKHTCAKGKPIKTTTCRAVKSKKLVVKSCDGRRRCKLKASNGVFGDPCKGTFKYLTVIYGCRRPCVRNASFNGNICKCKKGYHGNGFIRCLKKKVGRDVEEEERRDVSDDEGVEINEDELERA